MTDNPQKDSQASDPQSRPQKLGAFAEASAQAAQATKNTVGSVNTAIVERASLKKKSLIARYIALIFVGGLSMLKGMRITLCTFLNPKKTVTQEYPENRATLKMFKTFRGSVIMPHDENGEHNCTACTLCDKACPNGSINVLTTKNIAGKKILGKYIYRLDSCTLCALCVEACPFDAIRMGTEFEFATLDKNSLVQVLNEKEGRWKA